MAEERERQHGVREIRDPKTGKIVARVDETRREVELRSYRSRSVWVPMDEFLDRERRAR